MEKIIIIICVALILLILIFVILYNMLVILKKKVDNNKSLVDVFLKKRFDLIPNLVEVCKGYSKFERETLENIVKLRLSFLDNPDSSNIEKLNNEYKKVICLLEKYPELRASDSYLNLQKEIVNVEDELQASRRIYIKSIIEYNNAVLTIPSSIIARLFGFIEIDLPKYQYDEIKIEL